MKNCIDVKTDEVKLATAKDEVLGISSLGPCIGILFYQPNHKITIVAHVSSSNIWENKIKQKIDDYLNNIYILNNEKLKYLIIPGYMENEKLFNSICQYIKEKLPQLKRFKTKEIPNNSIKTWRINETEGSREFAFNIKTGSFITDKVNYIQLSNKSTGLKK